MVIISQKVDKHDFIGPSGGNQRKNLRSFDYFLCKTNPILSAVGGLQMYVSNFLKMTYENKSNWTLGENKPNSNPIKANLRKNECKLLCCKFKLFLLQLRQQNKTNAVSIERRPYEEKSFYPVAA